MRYMLLEYADEFRRTTTTTMYADSDNADVDDDHDASTVRGASILPTGALEPESVCRVRQFIAVHALSRSV